MVHIVMIPPSLIALNEEICNHPKLQERLAKHEDIDGELKNAKCYAEIGLYCGVALDDIYTPADMIKLADIFVTRLRHMRMSIITTSVVTEVNTETDVTKGD